MMNVSAVVQCKNISETTGGENAQRRRSTIDEVILLVRLTFLNVYIRKYE